MTKCIQYAYPTSTTAENYGCALAGCYFISIIRPDGWDEERRIGPFSTWEEAHDEAETINLPYHRYSAKQLV